MGVTGFGSRPQPSASGSCCLRFGADFSRTLPSRSGVSQSSSDLHPARAWNLLCEDRPSGPERSRRRRGALRWRAICRSGPSQTSLSGQKPHARTKSQRGAGLRFPTTTAWECWSCHSLTRFCPARPALFFSRVVITPAPALMVRSCRARRAPERSAPASRL
jgi:hypothetical protein